jgi:hypothetical protein
MAFVHHIPIWAHLFELRSRGRRDRMVVGFITTYAIGSYHHWSCESECCSGEASSIQHYVIKFLVTCDRSMAFSEHSGFLHQYNWPPRYNWNIVECCVKHHNHNLELWSRYYIYCTMLHLFDDLWLDKIIPNKNYLWKKRCTTKHKYYILLRTIFHWNNLNILVL